MPSSTPTDSSVEPFATRHVSQVLPVPPQNRWLIEPLWFKGGVGILGGHAKVCKTHLAAEMAIAVASGQNALGMLPVTSSGPVLFYGAEDALPMLRGRFEDRPDSLFVVDERLRIVAHPDRARAARLDSAAGTGIFSTVEDGVVPSGIARSGEYAAADGQLMLGSMTSLRTRPWAVVAQVPAEIAYASLRQMKLIVVIIPSFGERYLATDLFAPYRYEGSDSISS